MSAKYLGTYKGVVLRTNDPQNSGRIILQIPQILGSAESAWASPAKPTTEIPKIGDIVYVTFDGGDISYPVYAPAGAGATQIPKQPTALTLGTTAYSSPEGIAMARVAASWIVPTENQDGSTPVDLAGFVVSYAIDVDQWSGGFITLDSSVIFEGIPGGRTVYVRAASLSHANRASLYATANIATSATAPPPGSTLGTQSAAIGTLQTDLATANGRIDGKAVIWVQNSAPTGLGAADQGDIWINTSTADRISQVWDGAAWQNITDQKTLDVLATVNTKITTFYAVSTAPPTATAVGDLWVKTDLNNTLFRWNGATWVDVSDPRVPQAVAAAATAQSTADGKNTVYWSTSAPTVGTPGTQISDLWYQRDGTGNVIGMWRWTGTVWTSTALTDAILASLTVGKLVSGEIAAGVVVSAGPIADAHAEMTAAGFTSYTKTSTGALREAVRIGSSTTGTVFSVPDANGDPLAAISEDGGGAFAKLTANGDPTVLGFPLLGTFNTHLYPPSTGAVVNGWLDILPRGVVGFGQIGAVAYTGANTCRRELAFRAEPGRTYKITCGGGLVTFPGTAGTPAGFYLSVATPTSPGGDAAGVGAGAMIYSYNHVNVAGNMASLGAVTRVLRANKDGKTAGGELNHGMNRLMFLTNGSITPNDPIDILIEDIGPDIPDNDVANSTGTGSAGALTTITKTYNADGWATYRGTGTPLRGSSAAVGDTASKIYQGFNRDRNAADLDANGDQRGLWTFPSMTTDLTGATISKIEVYVDNMYSLLPAYTGYLGVHGYSLNTWPTGALPTLTAAITISGLRGAAQWVTLPTSLYAGFQSGSNRGVSIGPIGAMANSYCYFDAAAQMRATYTK